jgi:transketolase
MDGELKKNLEAVAMTIRGLSMDAVQKANSGHPGLPLGCAEFAAYLYGVLLRHNPRDSRWINRDRFILSAGHGSMLLYASLHLAGFDLPLAEIERFRQLGSKTPGHPEYRITDGVEATTGPLGQGVANAVGQALGLKLLAARFNTPEFPLFTGKVYCLAGDGCMMEGISSEASSLAGHLGLNNLVLVYDSNQICLDGPTSECLSEDTKMRYAAYGWNVHDLDGYDLDSMEKLFSSLQKSQEKPTLIVMRTVIGKGSPHKAGSHKAHGSPLGPEEVELTKKALGIPLQPFYVPETVRHFFAARLAPQENLEAEWQAMKASWAKKNPALADELSAMMEKKLPSDLEATLRALPVKSPIAGRSASQLVIDKLSEVLPQLYGGSADLSCSDLTWIKGRDIIARGKFTGRNIKYGVREFAMAAIAAGLAETGGITPFVGTFLTFSDYMRNALRLAALSKIQVIYQFTHDSIFLGEDGPTHQPIEHLAALRAIPKLHLIRPADAREVKMAWLAALRYVGPTAIVLSRQTLPDLPGTDVAFDAGVGRGAYILKREKKAADFTLFATGSEVSLALDVATLLEQKGKDVRVVSMPCWELFAAQDATYRATVVEGNLGKRVSIEAGVSFGWERWIGRDGISISIETFGESAPQADLATAFGFTAPAITEKLLK